MFKVSWVTVAAACVWLGGCADSSQPVVFDGWGAIDELDARDTPERIVHADGSFTYTLPRGIDENTFVQSGPLLWHFDGSVTYGGAPSAPRPTEIEFEVREVPRDPESLAMRMIRVDRHGRRWRPVERDAAMSDRILADYDAENGLEALDDDVPVMGETPVQVGERVRWRPTSWTSPSCSNLSFDAGVHIWNDDGRHRVDPDDMDRHHKPAVSIILPGNEFCSGFLVKKRFVLTAAHCLMTGSDPATDHYTGEEILVQRFDQHGAANHPLNSLAAVYIPGNYTGGPEDSNGTDFADDWAVIELRQTWTSLSSLYDGATTAVMSNASSSTLTNLDHLYNAARKPAALWSGTQCGVVSYGVYENREGGIPVTAVNGSRIRVRMDGSDGQSGSMVYFCPTSGSDDYCSSNERAHAVMVWAGWRDWPIRRHVGPRISTIRQTVLDFAN